MQSDHQVIEKVYRMENVQGQQNIKIENLESWVGDIHKTLKSVELRVTLATGAFLAIELFFKIWSR